MKIKKIPIKYSGYNNNILVGDIFRPKDNKSYPGILFCHGLATNRLEMKEFAYDLAKYGIISMVFDYSGHGESEGEFLLINEKSHLNDTNASIDILKKEKIKSLTVLGHSFGVKAALDAGIFNTLVDKIVLVSPREKSGTGLMRLKRILFLICGLFYNLFPFFPSVYVNKKIDYSKVFANKETIKKVKELNFCYDKINLKLLKYSFKINNIKSARRIKKPILVVIGKKDFDVSNIESENLFNNISSKKKKLVKLKNSGHSPFIDKDKNVLIKEIYKFCYSK